MAVTIFCEKCRNYALIWRRQENRAVPWCYGYDMGTENVKVCDKFSFTDAAKSLKRKSVKVCKPDLKGEIEE